MNDLYNIYSVNITSSSPPNIPLRAHYRRWHISSWLGGAAHKRTTIWATVDQTPCRRCCSTAPPAVSDALIYSVLMLVSAVAEG